MSVIVIPLILKKLGIEKWLLHYMTVFIQKIAAAPSLHSHDKDLPTNQRLVRRIEALELRIASAAPQDKVQRLQRRVEALELRFSSGVILQRTDSPVPNPREEALQLEVESLRASHKTLEEYVKVMQRQMEEMAEKIRAFPALANVRGFAWYFYYVGQNLPTYTLQLSLSYSEVNPWQLL